MNAANQRSTDRTDDSRFVVVGAHTKNRAIPLSDTLKYDMVVCASLHFEGTSFGCGASKIYTHTHKKLVYRHWN